MPPPTKIRFRGKVYPTLKEFAAAFGKHPVRVGANLRAGWTPAEAVGIKKRKRIGHGTSVVIDGVEYPTIRAACKALKLREATVAARMRMGYSVEDAFSGKLKPRVSAVAKPIIFRGVAYTSQMALAERFGQRSSNVLRRTNRGWTLEQALLLEPAPPRFRNFEGHARDRKWKEVRLDPDKNVEPIPDLDGFKLYEIRNKRNKKFYIGITVTNLAERLKQHFAAARKGRKAPLPNAIRKYGEKAFSIHLLRNDATTFLELQEQEVAEIQRRDAVKKGYNSAYGGTIGTSKPVVVNGLKYPSLSLAADHFGITRAAFLLRLNRLGWTPEEAAGLESRDWIGKKKAIIVRGKPYASHRAAAVAFGVPYKRFHQRLASGWSVDQALELDKPPSSAVASGLKFTFRGKKYQSLGQLAKEYGTHRELIMRWVKQGLSLNKAIEQTLKRKRKK